MTYVTGPPEPGGPGGPLAPPRFSQIQYNGGLTKCPSRSRYFSTGPPQNFLPSVGPATIPQLSKRYLQETWNSILSFRFRRSTWNGTYLDTSGTILIKSFFDLKLQNFAWVPWNSSPNRSYFVFLCFPWPYLTTLQIQGRPWVVVKIFGPKINTIQEFSVYVTTYMFLGFFSYFNFTHNSIAHWKGTR